jgi:hypothetical protein
MPPKRRGGGANSSGAVYRNDNLGATPSSNLTPSANYGSQRGINPLAGKPNQSKFQIAPLILEGVKLNKMQLNDVIKQHLKEIRISDIQLSRLGTFTLYASDVSSFNRLLNEFTLILATVGQGAAKIFVPRSIQRIKDTENVAFVKRVDLEIPESRITEALKDMGLDVVDVARLTNKVRNVPTSTIKITFKDPQNRNTFVHTGLQVESMHFIAEPAMQNFKPVQCYICLKYNHVAKYCKTKQQICARCGDNHHMDHCTAASDLLKCSNCQGKHLATSNDCSLHKEQEKRMLNLINQYTSACKPAPTAPALHNMNDFPLLPNLSQRQHDHLHSDMIDQIINALTSKMEKIIEETTSRIFKSLEEKIKKMEKSIASVGSLINDDDTMESSSDSDSDEEVKIVNDIKSKKQQPSAVSKLTKNKNNTPTASNITPTQSSTTNKDTTKKPPQKPKPTAKTGKRTLSPNSSLDSTTLDSKDLKTNNNAD